MRLIALMLILLFGGMAALPCSPAAADKPFMAGAGKVDITSPFPTRMGGYSARNEEFTGVHFPICVRRLGMPEERRIERAL